MAVFAIADTHLSLSSPKPMDRFGSRWRDHTAKLERRWRAVVGDGDTVILPGDISWAMTMEEAAADFAFLDSLPGVKLIGKGNHDYWWTTVKKMKESLAASGVATVDFMYNNAFRIGDIAFCGTRGWFVDESLQTAASDSDYDKLVARECSRLRLCLDAARATGADCTAVFFHFPPVYGDYVCRELVDALHKYGVTRCYYGHIHGNYALPRTVVYEGIEMTLISADFLDFTPLPVSR